MVKWKVPVLPWPALSPDLNPIKNLWGRLRGRAFANADALFDAAQQEWAAVLPALLALLHDSMASRCRAVVDARGHPTKCAASLILHRTACGGQKWFAFGSVSLLRCLSPLLPLRASSGPSNWGTWKTGFTRQRQRFFGVQ